MVETGETEKYIRKRRFTETGDQTQVSRDRKETRRTLREKRVNSNVSYVNVASSGQLVLRKWFIQLNEFAFSSLFSSSGGTPL